jgi:putative methionine-R-sulfoxide reductase with GAF domain/streptogramin lyase
MRPLKDKIIFLLCLCWMASSLRGQPVFFRTSIIDTRSEDAGDATSGVEDGTGMVWFGAQEGLWQYDGSRFELYKGAKNADGNAVSLWGTQVLRLSTFRPHWLWGGTESDGFWGLDLNTGACVKYRFSANQPNTPGGNRTTALYESPDGALWITSDNFVLTRFDGKNFKRFVPPPFPKGPETISEGGLMGGILPDPQNAAYLWTGSRFGLYRFDRNNETFEFFPFENPMRLYYEGRPVALYGTPDGIIWAGGFETDLLRLDPRTGQWKTIQIPLGRNQICNIGNILPWPDGRIWIINLPDAFLFYEPKSGKFDSGTPVTQMAGAGILLQHSKSPGQFPTWFLRAGGKLLRMTTAQPLFHFEPFLKKNASLKGQNWQRSYCLSPDRRFLYIGTLNGQGLLQLDWKKDTIRIIPHRADDDFPVVNLVYDDLFFDPDGKTLWIGTNNGLLAWREGWKNTLPYNQALPVSGAGNLTLDHHIDAIFADENNIWLGTLDEGVMILEKKTGRIHPLFPSDSEAARLVHKTKRLFCDRTQHIWICAEEGLFCVTPQGDILEKFTLKNAAGDSLLSSKVNDIEEDASGKLWIGTYQGLHCLDPKASPGHRITAYKNTEYDLANEINDLIVTPEGNVWLANEQGLSIFYPSKNRFINYTAADDLFPKQRMLIQLPDGRIISSARSGFVVNTIKNFEPSPAPSIYWRDFRVFDQPTVQSAGLNTLAELTLKPGENHFSFDFGAVNFEENARNAFAYQLEGFDDDWINSGARTFANYTNLSPGEYRFKVKASNRFGVWSEVRSIAVRILPPFYRTWWFYALLLVLTGLAVWQARRAWQMRQWAIEAQKIIDYFANSTYTGSSVDEILWDVARNCISRLDFEDTVIYMMDKERNVLVQKAACGPKNPEGFEILSPVERKVGQGIIGAVAVTGKSILLGDTRQDPRYIPDLEIRLSEVAVPIIHNGEVIGVLDSEHSRPNFFTTQHLDILQSIANLCSAKIVKAEAEEEVRRKEAKLLELDKRLTESELTALKAQMNPHFLFNCLNSINWYIIKNRPLEASKYLTKFSRLIRLILDNSKYQKVPLASELETLRLYIEMESIRFEQKFTFQIEIDDDIDAEDVKIAPMILQPYVENAIWHGLMPLDRPGHLYIHVSMRENFLCCTIEDDGIGRVAARLLHSGAVGTRESKGMRITSDRISILNQYTTGDDDFIQITDLIDKEREPSGTRVELKLPVDNQ